MEVTQKTALALAACDTHEQTFGTKVPPRVRELWRAGEVFRAHGRCLPPTTTVPTYETGSFRLAAVPPSWDVLAETGGLDDAVTGPRGEWTHIKNFLPLFAADESKIIVVRLDQPGHPVGWYDEGGFRSKGKGYDQGVFLLAPSLDAFLASLVDLPEANFEIDRGDAMWEDLAEASGDDDDDD